MIRNKCNLLFISPTIPQSSGNGRSMRAYNFIKLLSSTYNIYLLIISREHSKKQSIVCPMLSDLCHEITYVPIAPYRDLQMLAQARIYKYSRKIYYKIFSQTKSPYITRKMVNTLTGLFPEISFDVIHVFRLYMFPFVKCILREDFSGILQMDLDDIESQTMYNLGKLYDGNGNKRMGKTMFYEAASCKYMEKQTLAIVDRVFVCSQIDKEKIILEYACKNVIVIPNIVDIPGNLSRKPEKRTFTFLFVGNLGYYPNCDGVTYFCKCILPIIHQKTSQEILVKIIGSGATKALADALDGISQIELEGQVPDVAPCYHNADAVIVPLRAGGGTRIKVLEAFAHQRPVISTTLGAEGINVKDGEHFLAADTEEKFADQCLRIMVEPQLRNNLTRNAYKLVKEEYCLDSIRNKLSLVTTD